jgi:GNAT superfamily N-acetyltransferase
MRYHFRASLGDAIETEEQFVARCTGWMSLRLASGASWRCWVTEVEGKIVGHVWLQLVEKIPNPLAETECHGYVSNAFVEEKYRGRGLGSQLLEAALDYCRAEEVDSAFLWPTRESRRLYERLGFVGDGNVMEAILDGNRHLP